MKNSNSYCAAVAAFCLAPTAFAGIFVSTGQTGAQVQCDINHTQHWTYSVSENVSDIGGALLTMKGGSQTTSPISFVIFEGTYADFGSSAYLLSVTLDSSAFTQGIHSDRILQHPDLALGGKCVYGGALFVGWRLAERCVLHQGRERYPSEVRQRTGRSHHKWAIDHSSNTCAGRSCAARTCWVCCTQTPSLIPT